MSKLYIYNVFKLFLKCKKSEDFSVLSLATGEMGLRLRNRDWEIEELNVAFLNREGDEARSPES